MKKIYKGIDVFKLLAALGVVALHSNLIFLKTLGRIGVPFFVIISSYFFFKKYIMLDHIKQRERYVMFEKRILYLFLCWEVFYIPLALKNLMNYIQNKGLSFETIASYIYHFIFSAASAVNGWGPSWYLISMMIGITVFLLLLKLVKKQLWILGVICASIEVYYIIANEFGMYSHWNTIGTHGFSRLLIYILVGYLIAKYVNNFDKSVDFYLSIMLSCLIIFMIENYIIWKLGGSSDSQEVISSVPVSSAIAIFSIKWQPTIKSTTMFRKFSTFLYCIQAWPMWIMGHFVNINQGILNQIITFVTILVFAIISFEIYEMVKKKTQWQFWNYMV